MTQLWGRDLLWVKEMACPLKPHSLKVAAIRLREAGMVVRSEEMNCDPNQQKNFEYN